MFLSQILRKVRVDTSYLSCIMRGGTTNSLMEKCEVSGTDFFTADCHFGHVNKKGTGIIDYCNRPFSDIDEMNETLIEKWNAKVRRGDRVYHVGDFAFGDFMPYFKRLNGYIYFLLGDHDKDLDKDLSFKGKPLFRRDGQGSQGFVYRDRILRRPFKVDGKKQDITVCHWCMRTWPRSHYNSWHLYAHSHGRLPPIGKSWDIGMDNNDFEPISLEELKVIMDKQPDNPNFIKERR